MNKITSKESFDLFWYTLEEFGVHLLGCSDEDIGYYIFEEFDTNCISFLHENTLKQLLEAGLINKEIFDKSLVLADKFRKLENTPLWAVSKVKVSPEWLEILTLSDEIKKLISKLTN